MKGAKRLILSLEDTLFINVHKNPTNTEDMKEIEKSLYSITMEEYNKKEKLSFSFGLAFDGLISVH